jgi:hypothetical protein
MKIIQLFPTVALLCTCKPNEDTGKANLDEIPSSAVEKTEVSSESPLVRSESPLVRNLKFAVMGSSEHLIEVSDAERRLLDDAAPVLRKLAASPKYKKHFWSSISFNIGDPPAIMWQDAEKRLRKGEFRTVGQSHNKRLRLETKDYEEFVTVQESIDQAYAIIKEIDPKGVFIDYGTE